MKSIFIGLTKLVVLLTILVAASLLFSQLATIHGSHIPEDYFSTGYPSILKLLDSEAFMGFIFVVTVAVIVYVIYLFWQLHEVAVHRAHRLNSAHTQIVFALSLCGLFIDKTWWVLAIIIAFTRWDIIGQQISNVIRAGKYPSTDITEEHKS
ncbi:magnesium transporter [Alginatibacterium sediminis]|nr:magnesium transporter [Alginatibacterium sediminis]